MVQHLVADFLIAPKLDQFAPFRAQCRAAQAHDGIVPFGEHQSGRMGAGEAQPIFGADTLHHFLLYLILATNTVDFFQCRFGDTSASQMLFIQCAPVATDTQQTNQRHEGQTLKHKRRDND